MKACALIFATTLLVVITVAVILDTGFWMTVELVKVRICVVYLPNAYQFDITF